MFEIKKINCLTISFKLNKKGKKLKNQLGKKAGFVEENQGKNYWTKPI